MVDVLERRGMRMLAIGAAFCIGGAMGATPQRLTHNGLVVDFTAERVDGAGGNVMEGMMAEVRFRIADAAGGQPLRGIAPGAWMDMTQVMQNREGAEQKSCKDKVALYLKGVVGMRPMVDLNSYFVVLLNGDASISVVDPLVTMAGVTSTFATTALEKPGADWVNHDNTRRLFVTMPKAGAIAVIETDNFKVARNVPAGTNPTRIALQPDKRYAWVGNDAADAKNGGVSVIDADSLEPAGFVATGAGHHEIAFSSDSRFAFVTNREGGTVSVIDTATRRKVKEVATGTTPLSVGYSALSRMAYVSDGRDGTVTAIDGERHEAAKRIVAAPGLGPLRVTPDGRFVLVVNIADGAVHVIDTASNEVVQRIPIGARPYQVTFSETFAYVRALGSERVSMINLATLGKGKKATVQSFLAGAAAPEKAGELAIADSVASASQEGTIFVVSPADGSTYYYREGMNAPSSNYRVYGSSPRAVTVVDRSLKEVEPGVYSARVKIPVAGRYDVAFMTESPQVLHCFSMDADANPAIPKVASRATAELEGWPRETPAGQPLSLRFRVFDPATGQPKAGLRDAQAMYFLAPGARRTQVPAREVAAGVYQVDVTPSVPGAYYIYLGVPSMELGYGKMPYHTLNATPPADALATGGT